MIGMRDVLIHDYMGVNLMTVWKVAQERLPEIKLLMEGLSSSSSEMMGTISGLTPKRSPTS